MASSASAIERSDQHPWRIRAVLLLPSRTPAGEQHMVINQPLATVVAHLRSTIVLDTAQIDGVRRVAAVIPILVIT